MLPGQELINGVSNYIFGSNISPDYQATNARSNAQIQAQLKSAGITIMRCAIPANSPDSYIDQTATACANIGAAMLVILDFSKGAAWCQHLVQHLGSRCDLYEFRNEPDLLSGYSWQAYANDWIATIPQLRALNQQAAFIGPVLGVFDNLQGWLVPWLQQCQQHNVLPDAISFHVYPCTGNYTAATCSPRATSFADAATKANAAVQGVLGHTLPLCLTEWNIDAANPVHGFATDPGFVPGWTKTAIDSIVQGGYAMACQWDAGGNAAGGADDLISVATLQPNSNGQYQAFAERVQHYLSGSGGGGTGGGGTSTPPPITTGVHTAELSFTLNGQTITVPVTLTITS